MKSPLEYFIIEQDTNPRKGEREAQERLIKKLNRISKKGNIPDKLPYADGIETSDGREGRPSETRKKMAKEIATQDIEKSSGRESSRIGSEGSGKVKEPVKPEQARGYKPKPGSQKLPEYPGGSVVKTNKPQQKPLGRLVHKVTKERKAKGLKIGDLDYRDSKQLEAQRKGRIDTRRNLPSGQPNPKYGKATQKGVENFAQNRGGYGRGRKLSKTEWEKIEGSAKKISSDPSSKAYKDIEAKINKNRDYGGKRAQVMNPKQVAQVKKEKDKFLSKNRKGGKLTIQRTSKLLDTKTRKGRIANIGSPPTPPPNNPSFRKSVKGPGSSTGYLSKGNIKFSGDDVYNDLKKKIKTTDGRSTNKPPRRTPKFVGKPSPTNTTVNSKPRSSDYQTRRTPVPTGSKSSPVSQRKGYSIKNDLDALKKLNKKNKVKNIFSSQPSPEPWKPSDTPSVKSRNKVDLDAEFRRKWKTAQEKWKSDGVSPENVSKTKNKFKYDSPSMKKPSIRSYTSPTLKPLNFKPSSSGGGFTPPGDGPTKTKSKVTSNYTKPTYKKPSPWKRLKNWRKGGMPGVVPALFGVAGGIDMAQQQKERGATTSRQIKTGLLSGASDAASWVTASSLANMVFKKRPILKLATQIAGSSYISNQIDKVASKYYDSPTKAEIKAGKDAETITYEKWRKKNKAFLIPGAGRDKKQSSPSLVGGFAANQSGKLKPDYGK